MNISLKRPKKLRCRLLEREQGNPVDIRVPSGAAPGTAKVQVNGAYLPGTAFNLPVQ